jgi:hypothetical protein
MASHPDMQKIWKNGVFLENSYIGSLKFGCYYLHYIAVYKGAWGSVVVKALRY